MVSTITPVIASQDLLEIAVRQVDFVLDDVFFLFFVLFCFVFFFGCIIMVLIIEISISYFTLSVFWVQVISKLCFF